ncbi:uncharacterized protein LOC134823883 [Bolinopsis microptera]|uniref:uncharacterized protein LOC134823883 n=1 Tax=Bolinopsis microptera TaxID=2820187 RepID=UPI00307A4A8F
MKGKEDLLRKLDEYSIEYPITTESEATSSTKLRMMVLTMCLSIFSTNLVSSMCAPFYPRSAAHHGLDSDVTGTILGVYYATTVLASPFMAIFMTKIGQANLLQLGLVLVGTSSLVFGGIDKIDNSLTFGVISFVLRGLQGVGCAATDTAVFAIASSRFTKHLGKVSLTQNNSLLSLHQTSWQGESNTN